MKTFDYHRSSSLDETIGRLGPGARPYAGGTDLLTLMKQELVSPPELIDIKDCGLKREIREADDGVHIGALTTLSDIERSPLLKKHYPLLGQAAAEAATPQLRNRATVAGNLLQRPRCWYFRSPHIQCWLQGGEDCPAREGENQRHALFGDSPCVAVHPSDLASCLLAVDARLSLRSPQGEHTLPLTEFFAQPEPERRQENIIRDDELILAVHLPLLPAGSHSLYLKEMDRKTWSFALTGLAAVLQQDAGRISHLRLVLSGVAPVPWRLPAVEKALLDSPVDKDHENFQQASTLATQDAQPLAHNGYKIALIRHLTERALQTLIT